MDRNTDFFCPNKKRQYNFKRRYLGIFVADENYYCKYDDTKLVEDGMEHNNKFTVYLALSCPECGRAYYVEFKKTEFKEV